MSRPKTDTGASDFVAMIDPAATAAPNGAPESAGAPRRTLIVANRLPATVVAKDGAVDVEPSVGGVATGLKSVHQQGGGWWIGWPGEIPRLPPDARKALDAKLAAMRLLPVVLSANEVKRFYEGYANGVLWPLFHYQIERVPLDSRDFSAYRTVNQKYADAIASVIEPGDAVWIHDYQLALVPAMLRERAPDARIGFFLHIPFPSSEVFRVLPQREEVLHGLLGADLVGFHTFAYLRHFATSAARVLGLEPEFDRVEHDGREVRFGVFPMGIDAKRFAALAAEDDVLARVEVIRRGAPEKIILGIDRLDYTKGLRRRLLAFGRFLETHAE
ncbi:MAG TPA: trehalose-6-phosphate synthase, partial [Planctomycetota bacterium]|nr:trehalose-6-phosphate synthase [Planctomycetota bacterium]